MPRGTKGGPDQRMLEAEKERSSPGAGMRRLSDLPLPLVPVRLQLTAVDKANFTALGPSVVCMGIQLRTAGGEEEV